MRRRNKQLARASVRITDGQWTDRIGMRVKGMTEWGVRQLQLWGNYREDLVKEIAHVHFTSLTYLVLENNFIELVDVLPRMQMPHIEKLHLRFNCITSVKAIREGLFWGSLQQLKIEYNYIRDGQRLTEGFFPKMENLQVQFPFFGRDFFNQFADLCFPSKIQGSLKCLSALKNFCFSRSLQPALQRRYPGIQIKP